MSLQSTLGASAVVMILDGEGPLCPRIFGMGFTSLSTYLSSDVSQAGFLAACGDGSKGPSGNIGMRLTPTPDIFLHRSSSATGAPGVVTIKSVIGSTPNVAPGTTLSSTAWGGSYDVTVSST
jgi:hypothetical protein